MLQAYPNLYVVDRLVHSSAEFQSYLTRLVQAGFADRIMFGSDQMQWPDAIGVGIRNIESAAFLSEAQKKDILCRNAAHFFRLDSSLCR